LWEEKLQYLPNRPEDIAATLERVILLRDFQRKHVGVEAVPSGSVLHQLIGVGDRRNKDGTTQPFGPKDEYTQVILRAFSDYPIAKYYGITIDDAMHLPLPTWIQIRKSAPALRDREVEEMNLQDKILKLLKDLVTANSGGE